MNRMTDKEIALKNYPEKVNELITALRNNLVRYEIGKREENNRWTSYDFWELAINLSRRGLTPLGVCYDVPPDGELKAAVCVEDNKTFRKFWCHFHGDYIHRMILQYEGKW